MKRQHGFLGTFIFACVALLTMAAAAQPAGRPLRLVVLGDSLSAGYGLPQSAAFPAVLERSLKARGHKVEIVNAGVSGDTATGGLERLDWSVPEEIVARLKARNIPVMLAGMVASRNLGPDYARKFEGLYREIADRHALVLYPFFLDGVAGDRSLNLPDGIHPTQKGVEIIVERILPSVETFLTRLAAS
jgi:acyl-CoA thioesterase I